MTSSSGASAGPATWSSGPSSRDRAGVAHAPERSAARLIDFASPWATSSSSSRSCSPRRCSSGSPTSISIPYPIVLVAGGVAIGFVPGLPDDRARAGGRLPGLPAAAAARVGVQRLAAGAARRDRAARLADVRARARDDGRRRGRLARRDRRPELAGGVRARRDPVADRPRLGGGGVQPDGGARARRAAVEGEAMLNDAAALVAYKVAVTATVAGTFALGSARRRVRRLGRAAASPSGSPSAGSGCACSAAWRTSRSRSSSASCSPTARTSGPRSSAPPPRRSASGGCIRAGCWPRSPPACGSAGTRTRCSTPTRGSAGSRSGRCSSSASTRRSSSCSGCSSRASTSAWTPRARCSQTSSS